MAYPQPGSFMVSGSMSTPSPHPGFPFFFQWLFRSPHIHVKGGDPGSMALIHKKKKRRIENSHAAQRGNS